VKFGIFDVMGGKLNSVLGMERMLEYARGAIHVSGIDDCV